MKSRYRIMFGLVVFLASLAFTVQAIDLAASGQAAPGAQGGAVAAQLAPPAAPAAPASDDPPTLVWSSGAWNKTFSPTTSLAGNSADPAGLSQAPTAFSPDQDNTTAIAWGDVDADGDLDLAVGNGNVCTPNCYGTANKIYLNMGGVLSPTAVWSSYEGDATSALAWGDVNGDGYLDLAVANGYQPERVYLNAGGMLERNATWSVEAGGRKVAWGDMNGDGFPELTTGCQVFLNVNGMLQTTSTWTPTDGCGGMSAAWGDMDGDQDLDLAVSGRGSNIKVYLNQDGTLSTTSILTTTDGGAWSIAWGDVDGDGDLDLAAGNDAVYAGRNKLYLNTNGMLGATAVWTSTEEVWETHSVAWGDVDGDGDLDLVAGGKLSPRIYANVGGTLALSPTWTAIDDGNVAGLAWGDIDGDSDLELAVGNTASNGGNRLYLNQGGLLLQPNVMWNSADSSYSAKSVAWGDMNGDGQLDLAVAKIYQNKAYLNAGSTLTATAAWNSTYVYRLNTHSLAWGDVDGDGDLDLAAGNGLMYPGANGEPNYVYLNVNGMLQADPAWSAGHYPAAHSVAWGDVDGDGDLDLAVSGATKFTDPNIPDSDRVYLNVNGQLQTGEAWSSADTDDTFSLAWGDIDGDGDLDLATGNWFGPNKIYLNANGMLQRTAAWASGDADYTTAVAWGDIDGDGDLDLAAGNFGGPTRIYRNDAGTLEKVASWVSYDYTFARDIAWGDADGDGDLDLACANSEGSANTVYLNENGELGRTAAWKSTDSSETYSVAWGDVDGDGVLDLAAADNFRGKVYRGIRPAHPLYLGNTSSIALGLYSDPVQTFSRTVTALAPANFYAVPGIRSAATIPITFTLSDPRGEPVSRVRAFYSLDGGDHWRVAVPTTDTITRNLSTVQSLVTSTTPMLAINDVDVISSTLTFSRSGQIDDLMVRVTINHTESRQLAVALHSSWPPPTGTTILLFNSVGRNRPGFADLTLSGYARYPITHERGGLVGYWKDGYFKGFIDDVRIYNRVLPAEDVAWLAGGDFDPFDSPLSGDYRPVEPLARLRGAPLTSTFTLIVSDTTPGGAGTLVNWQLDVLPTNPITHRDHRYTWDVFSSGFFGQSDNVVFRIEALPNLGPSVNGVPGPFQRPFISAQTYPFRVRGTQVRVLSDILPAANALVYRLPAGQSSGAAPLSNHTGQPYRTDALGYLQGRGQLDMGDRLVAILPITATDAYTLYYTSAAPIETGLNAYTVLTPGVQALTVSAAHPLILFNLDVSLEWDARKDTAYLEQLQFDLRRTSEILYDVTNGQAALGDVTLYYDREHWFDADVRIYATNVLRPNATIGGIRTAVYTEVVTSNPYAPPNTTFPYTLTYGPGLVRIGVTWNRFGEASGTLGEDWPRTLAHELGHYLFALYDNYIALDANGVIAPSSGCRNSLMTNQYLDAYSELRGADGWEVDCALTLSAQRAGRADWETATHFYPWLSAAPENPGPSGLPLAVTQIRAVEPVTPPLTLDVPIFYVTRNGASYQPGVRAQAILYQAEQLIDLGKPTLDKVRAWGARPGDRLCVYELTAAQLGCETIRSGDAELALVAHPGWQPEIIVTPLTSRTVALTVTVTAAGLDMRAQLYPINAGATAPITLEAGITAGVYTGRFTLARPCGEGYLQVWVAEADPRREIVTNYALGGNPGQMQEGFGQMQEGFGQMQEGFAPAASSDGQVILYSGAEFGVGQFYAVQKATTLPQPPPWATVVGDGHWLLASPNAPDFAGASLNFRYLGKEVPPGEESFLRVYYWDGVQWEALPTLLNVEYNEASAAVRGAGLYALMSSLEISLDSAGWNLFSYPVQATRSVTDALLSINSYYTTVYGYEPRDLADPWKVFDKTAPGYANQLQTLEFGKGYWISVTQAITLQLKGASLQGLANLSSGMGDPPATYYGPIVAGPDFTPTVGVSVTAWIDGNLCGQGSVLDWHGQVVYTLDVFADWVGQINGCGLPGRTVRFRVGEQDMAQAVAWNNSRVWPVALSVTEPPPDGVAISGPGKGVSGKEYTFTATVTSTVGTSLLPLTYVWEATGQAKTITHTGGGLSNTVVFSWMAPGDKLVTVSTMNPGGMVSNTHTITIQAKGWYIYLPVVLKNSW